ncbi:hypothetical protein BD560DRAFT_399519 [Blakeslea trispora]|nr:hypothetical protein BD560DRAFT_399519 [Blakeslea trispora]
MSFILSQYRQRRDLVYKSLFFNVCKISRRFCNNHPIESMMWDNTTTNFIDLNESGSHGQKALFLPKDTVTS